MKFKFDRIIAALAVTGSVVYIDRLTKQWALQTVRENSVDWGPISFELAFNRGISWGMLHSYNPIVQHLLMALIAGILLLFIRYTYDSYMRSKSILPHAMIIAGALSNLSDRIWYPGVVDFIVISAYGWHFPSFNCADASIVIGVVILFLSESEFFLHE